MKTKPSYTFFNNQSVPTISHFEITLDIPLLIKDSTSPKILSWHMSILSTLVPIQMVHFTLEPTSSLCMKEIIPFVATL